VKQNFSSIETVIIGENHGVIENVQVIRDVLSLSDQFKKTSCIAFEYPRELLPLFEKALRENNYESLVTNKEVIQLLFDGRFSQDHFNFLFEIYNKKVKLLFIDCLDKTWDYRDRAMFDLISSAKPFLPKDTLMLVVVGSLHAEIETAIVKGRPYIPLGSYFDKSMLVVHVKYLEGSFWNRELQTFQTQNKEISPTTQFEELSDRSVNCFVPLAHPTRTE
jgi:hypothetical protein